MYAKERDVALARACRYARDGEAIYCTSGCFLADVDMQSKAGRRLDWLYSGVGAQVVVDGRLWSGIFSDGPSVQAASDEAVSASPPMAGEFALDSPGPEFDVCRSLQHPASEGPKQNAMQSVAHYIGRILQCIGFAAVPQFVHQRR